MISDDKRPAECWSHRDDYLLFMFADQLARVSDPGVNCQRNPVGKDDSIAETQRRVS